jgi:riboflavin kinase/FMN adenylyltransferase
LLSLTAEEFFARFIEQSLQARGMVEGPNFFFGRDRRGDVTLLSRLCREMNIPLEIVPSQLQGPGMISSSRIRQLLELGEVRTAGELLTQPYRIRGTVVTGAARGRSLGFPTANLDEIPVLIPRAGVYAGRAYCADRILPAALHLGPNPTFSQGTSKVEVHLLDFSGDLYGQVLQVDFLDKVRDIVRFASVDELRSQVARDLNRVRELVNFNAH